MSNTKHDYRYNIQYFFIPKLIEAVSAGAMPPMAFTNTGFWESVLKDIYDKDFVLEEGYNCEVLKINERYNIFFYTFPEPEEIPEALYGAIVVDNQEHTMAYFTLEMDFNNSWIIGSKTPDKHHNFGTLGSRNPEAFIEWILGKL